MTQKVTNGKVQRWFKMVIALFAAAVLIASCSDKDDSDNALNNAPAQPNENIRPDIPEQPTPDAPKTYTLSIPATFGDKSSLSKAVTLGGTDDAPTATGTFDASEKIYVYNATKGEMCSDDDNYLSPTNISADGKSCTLSGSFIGTIEEGDQITLLYNLSRVYSDPTYCKFSYDGASDIIDGGIAEGLKVTSTDNGRLTTESQAVFQLCQSIFRFKFVDDGGNPINVKTLLIESSAIASYYWPLESESDKYTGYQVTKTFAAATSDYINIALCIDEEDKNNAFSFTVTDGNNNIYKGTRNAPSAGFRDGEYYFNTTPIKLEKQSALVEPTITWGEGTDAVTPDEYRQYDVYGPNSSGNQPSTLTISGTSQGYYFWLNWGSNTTLDNLTAIRDENNEFIYSDGGDLNLIISGTNTITCKENSQAIFVDGTLKISGNGTLTVTANYIYRNGLYAESNYNDNNNSDPSVLAAEGYTVTCSDMIDNGDDTYTWTYTVKPNDQD
ncbi:MAG: hypothetical protein II852_12245 [Bacteroidales bacterium]|nr:hypothetical protein [Bacteroidales bacterium]